MRKRRIQRPEPPLPPTRVRERSARTLMGDHWGRLPEDRRRAIEEIHPTKFLAQRLAPHGLYETIGEFDTYAEAATALGNSK